MITTAIVVQGKDQGKRTQSIISYYLEHNPHSLVVFSTWKTFDGTYFDKKQSEEPRFRFIQSDFPAGPGSANRHYQRWSTYYGIQEAIKYGGITHVLKIRSDQLFKNDNICESLQEFLVRYGEDRFVVGHSITQLDHSYGPYHLGDFWLYSKISNMLEWYDIAGIDSRKQCVSDQPCTPEADFLMTWMRRHDLKYEFERMLTRYFIVLNCDSLRLLNNQLPLDASDEDIEKFWATYRRQNVVVRHEVWLEMMKRDGELDKDK